MRGVRFIEVAGDRVLRHAVDQVNNNLAAELRWCSTHVEPVWVFSDGSYQCPHALVVGWDSDGGHVLTALPFAVGEREGTQ